MQSPTTIQQPNSICPFSRGLTWYTYKRQERKLAEALRYTAIDPTNLKSWGEEYADMLRSIGDDVDSCFREMAKCVVRNCGASVLLSGPVNSKRSQRDKSDLADWNINDYVEVFEPLYQLSENRVAVPFAMRGIPPLYPFRDFSSQNSPLWWRAYNHIKHTYYDAMEEGMLENTLSALAGLLLLNAIHKCSQHYLAMQGIVSGGTKIGEFTQSVPYEYLTEELQKSSLGIPKTSTNVPFTWLRTEIFLFEYRRI